MSNPDINIHLLNLVKQYKSDVETRISVLENEAKLCGGGEIDDVLLEDVNEQISHWQITLLQINEVLKECK
jgi:hypothetical protein